MSNLPLLDPDTAEGPLAELFSDVKAKLGAVPNMTRAMANSPAMLRSYLALSDQLARGRLRPAVREQISLAIARRNRCDYCMSAHSFAAEHIAHLQPDAIIAAREATSTDPRTEAVLRLAVAINDQRGSISTTQLADARRAGLDDTEISEIIANVALNVLTNYFNKVADTDIDFPYVASSR